jgi:FkbM family methyltransferase
MKMNNMNQAAPGLQLDEIFREDPATVPLREKNAFDQLIAPFNNSIVLFGAGNLGQQVLAQLRIDGVEPLAFSDNNAGLQGTGVNGLNVLSPESAATQYGRSAVFVVTAWNTNHSFVETQKMLQALGCVKVVSVATFRWKHPENFLPFFWADLPGRTCEHAEEIKAVFPLWADDLSRREYLAQLQWRVWGDFDFLARPVLQESYFPNDLFDLLADENFVDCGAYDGITIQQFVSRQSSFAGRVLAFEPDPANFARLQTYLSSLDSKLRDRIEVFPYAVSAAPGKVRFDATGDMGAAISRAGALEVDCFPLDDIFAQQNFSPTYIKMDIEGAELDALSGAQQTIRSQSPVLAICSYHRYDDLWRIPAFIHSLYPDYSLFLRPHEIEGWQLVCYAVPKGRLKK